MVRTPQAHRPAALAPELLGAACARAGTPLMHCVETRVPRAQAGTGTGLKSVGTRKGRG